MIPRLTPAIDGREILKMIGWARHDAVTQFERVFADKAGARHAIAFPYGRTALICLLEALGINNKQVICPSYTCVVVPHAVNYSGNQPYFVDCAENSFLMDLELASAAVTTETGAIIATSFFGEPVDLDKLQAFKARHPHVAIIQDCAHSFFCEDKGRPVHLFGKAAIYGLNVSKIITSVFGGMITTDDAGLAATIRRVRLHRVAPASLAKSISRRLYFLASSIALQNFSYGFVRKLSELGALDRVTKYYSEEKIDMPLDYLSGLTAFEAEVGISQVEKYDAIVAHRRRLAKFYNASLGDATHLKLPSAINGSTWSHYVVRSTRARYYLAEALSNGIELGDMLEYFIPDMPTYRSNGHADRGIARSYINNVVNLPVHVNVNADAAAKIVLLMRSS